VIWPIAGGLTPLSGRPRPRSLVAAGPRDAAVAVGKKEPVRTMRIAVSRPARAVAALLAERIAACERGVSAAAEPHAVSRRTRCGDALGGAVESFTTGCYLDRSFR